MTFSLSLHKSKLNYRLSDWGKFSIKSMWKINAEAILCLTFESTLKVQQILWNYIVSRSLNKLLAICRQIKNWQDILHEQWKWKWKKIDWFLKQFEVKISNPSLLIFSQGANSNWIFKQPSAALLPFISLLIIISLARVFEVKLQSFSSQKFFLLKI